MSWKDSKNMTLTDHKKGFREQIKNNDIENVNAIIARRLYYVMSENRLEATTEYAPGWRLGKKVGGTVIDCYASERNDAMKHYYMHSRSLGNAREERNRVRVIALSICFTVRL